MSDKQYVLGQADGTTSLANLYVVPDNDFTSTVVSTLLVCNRTNAQKTFKVRIGVAGASATDKDYLFYDTPIPANGTITATLGITLGQTDVIQVSASVNSSLSFSLFGVETRT